MSLNDSGYFFSERTISGLKKSYNYSKKAIKPSVTITVSGRKLVKGTDYTVTYKNNTKLGTAKMTINGKGNYKGSKTANFKIRPFKVNSDPTVSTNAVNDYISVVTSSNSEGLGKAPLGIAIPAKWKWPKERVVVNNAYSGFTAWGKQSDLTLRAGQSGWYQNPVSGTVYGE